MRRLKGRFDEPLTIARQLVKTKKYAVSVVSVKTKQLPLLRWELSELTRYACFLSLF